MRDAIVLALILALAPTLAAAQAYRWVDENGVVHYSDSLNNIPEKLRSSVKPLGVTPPKPPDKAPQARPWEVEDTQGKRLSFPDRGKCEDEAEKISKALNRTVFCQQRAE